MEKNLKQDRQSTNSRDQEIWINPVHGYIYQLKLLMLFLHRGLSCGYSFRLGAEIKKAKKFDDLVFEYDQGNKKFYRLLQAKHKSHESRKITADELLTDPKGDYSLVKYFKSFQDCKKEKFFEDGIFKDVIICTNINFDFDNLRKFNIEIKKVEEKDDILDINCNEKVSARYKFTNSMVRKLKSRVQPTWSDDDIECFLNHLVFAVNQPNEEELGQIVKKEIGREMGFINSENTYNKLLVKMIDLTLGKESSMFFSHEEGKKIFTALKEEITVWFNIQNPSLSFTGRLDYLKMIHENLTTKFQVCISGMGGVGKTELVRKYIADYGYKNNNQIVWINAECYKTASDCFRQLASDKLDISLNSSDGKEKHIRTVVQDVYQFLAKDKSLFIFDNAEKYKCKNEFDCGIDQFLPCLPSNFTRPNVIITSRNQKWPESVVTIILEPFTSDEARELISKILTIENNEQKEQINELSEKLEFLPLALQQAIAYMKMEKEKLACIGENFKISNYSKMAQKILDFEFSEDDDSSYDKSVFTTWNITFDTLKQKENGQDALDILNIISYFLPDNIPVELLLIFSIDKEKLSSAIGLLKQYSIVSVQHKAVSVHRLVQQVTQIKLQRQNAETEFLQNALKLLNGGNINFKNVDHVISMWTFASKEIELLEEYVHIFGYITDEVRNCGRIKESQSIGLEASKLLNALPLSNIHVQNGLLAVQYNDAKILLNNGEYKAALKQFHEVEKKISDSSISKNSVKSSIAKALHKLGKNKEALQYYYEVLNANRVDLEENHPDILEIEYSISVILSEEGKHQEALSMLQKIYDVQKEALGNGHEKTLRTRSNIASTLGGLVKMSKIEEPLEILEEVCNDQMATLPKNHPDILVTKLKMANTLPSVEKCEQALKIYQELLDVQKENLGENHPQVIEINISIAELKLRKKVWFESIFKPFKNAYDKLRVTPDPEILKIEVEIYDVFMRQKKFQHAIKLLEENLDKQISVLGNDHPDTLQTRRSVASILEQQMRYDVALEVRLKVLQGAESIHGKDHPKTLDDKKNLGWLYWQKKDFEKSLAILKEVLEAQESSLGKDDIKCRVIREYIEAILEEQTRYDQFKFIDSPEIIEAFSRHFDVNAKHLNGETPLYTALNADDERLIKVYLQIGAEIFITSNLGNTPLHIAVSKGQVKYVKLLLEKLKPERMNDFVDAKNTTRGFTALHGASELGYLNIVKYLVKSHATFCAKSKDGQTPLDLSTDPEITNFLKMVHEIFEDVTRADAGDIVKKLEELPDEDFLAIANTRNDRGLTLTQVAILNKQKQVADKILKMLQESKSN